MPTLTADGTGKLIGHFTIPSGIPAGTKLVKFTGQSGSTALASFTGRGQITTEELQLITIKTLVVTTYWEHADPLAETFTLSAPALISGVDLWVCAKGSSGKCFAQIREVRNGVPVAQVLADCILSTSLLVLNQWNRFSWNPVRLESGREYAIVVGCDDATTSIMVAQLGQFDSTAQQWVTQQPYQVGVLLSSSNASTWTAEQTRDMTFRLLATPLASTTATIPLPSVTVTNADEVIVLAAVTRPTSACDCQFQLTLPNATVLVVPEGQRVVLPQTTTGVIQISALLTGSATATPLLQKDVALVWGSRSTSGTYIERAIPAGTGSTVAVFFEVLLPGTASMTVDVSPDGSTGWVSVPFVSGTQIGDGWVDTVYRLSPYNSALAHTRLTLHGDSRNRPQVRKLRTVVT